MEEKNTTQTLRLHKSVLVEEVLAYLDPKPDKVYLDVTFGTGGHTRALLEKEPECRVIAMDWDAKALETYGPQLQEEFDGRLRLVWGNFALLYKILKKESIKQVDGVLADFGTSQIHITERPGFSMYRDTPLDMRMSPPHQKITAEDVVGKSSEEKLRELLWQLGQEQHAKYIARAIVLERSKKRIKTTKQLADIIERAVPKRGGKRGERRRIHPATKTFQALRIYINRELNNISAFLPMALNVLCTGGRLVCISFHSLEDRLVKQFFKEQEHKGELKILTPRVVVPTEQEVYDNPSSRSSKLRAAQKC